MTQDHSALLAQLDALKSADSGAVFAELIRAGLQALIEAEATEAVGAGRYQRSAERGTHRNGAPTQNGVDHRRRYRGADSQAAGRIVFPVVAGAAPPYR
jgi:transposase-like protein